MELKIDDAQVSGTDKKAKLDADGAHAQWFGKWRKTLDTACDRCPLVVGVFMNQDMEEVKKIALDVGLDMVQLHGNEGFEVATEEHCGVPAFRVVHVLVGEDGAASSDLRAKNTLAEIKSGLACGVLLDTKVKGLLGGTGTTFDWDVAAAVGAAGVPVMVAGGLTAENIKEAVQKTSPWVVDVSSGVEESPGKKDHAKIQAFVQGARS
jgi:phosphoribosylanthranilate isomerase